MVFFYLLFCVFAQRAFSYNFTLYTNNIPNGTENLLELDQSARTIFIIHGWQQSGDQPWVIEIKNVYLQTSSVNVIVFDWSEDASSLTYYPSVYKVPHVGRFLGQKIYTLYFTDLIQVKSTQLVGFSLGAHVAGIASQTFTEKSNGTKIKIIVGLEAASPGFESVNDDKRLDATDAEFVQGFHTSNFGLREPYAIVDVYFNYKHFHGCGVEQPSCPWYPGVAVQPNSPFPPVFCDHMRSVAYFIQTISSNRFLAVLCTCSKFYKKKCNAANAIVIGEQISLSSAPGEYFISTSCRLPFSLGYDGVIGGESNYKC